MRQGLELIGGILAALWIGILTIKLYKLKKALKDVNKQLKEQCKTKAFSPLQMELGDKEMEELGERLNDYLRLYSECEARSKATEIKLKRAIANMSHDLRTPLTSILGYIQLLREEDVTLEEKEKFLEVAQKKGKSLQGLLNDFFKLSVVESVDYELSLQPINVDNLVKELLFSYYDHFIQKQVQPELLFPNKPLWVLGDEEAITRVVENLVGNVLKHAKGEVKVKLYEVGEQVDLEVSNWADGLSQEAVDKLFDRFYKADKIRMGNGAGLGLCIAKSFMEKMGGSMEAHLEGGRLVITCRWEKVKDKK